MSKILVIQFRVNPFTLEQEKMCLCREIGEEVKVEFVSALDKSIDWNSPELLLSGYGGVILGGSGDFDFDGSRPPDDEIRKKSLELVVQLKPLFQYLFDNDILTLGICYGHQMLGAFAGARVHNDIKQKKTKSHQVSLLVSKHDYLLFTNLPDTFFAHYGHKDVLDRIPEGAVLLMSGGEQCQFTALKYKNNIYTVQFHPELTFSDMIERAKITKNYLPEGQMVEEIFKDEPHSNIILQNFAKMVASK